LSTTKLQLLKERLQMYYDAEKAILEGAQSYQIGSRQITRATIFRVQDEIRRLENEIAIEESKLKGKGRNRTFGIIPRDF
jgi:hypothetical protein